MKEIESLLEEYHSKFKGLVFNAVMRNRWKIEIVSHSTDHGRDDKIRYIFKLGEKYYSVESTYPSFAEEEQFEFNTLKEVTPKTKEVTYYE